MSANGRRRVKNPARRAYHGEEVGTLWRPALREVSACGALSARRFAESHWGAAAEGAAAMTNHALHLSLLARDAARRTDRERLLRRRRGVLRLQRFSKHSIEKRFLQRQQGYLALLLKYHKAGCASCELQEAYFRYVREYSKRFVPGYNGGVGEWSPPPYVFCKRAADLAIRIGRVTMQIMRLSEREGACLDMASPEDALPQLLQFLGATVKPSLSDGSKPSPSNAISLLSRRPVIRRRREWKGRRRARAPGGDDGEDGDGLATYFWIGKGDHSLAFFLARGEWSPFFCGGG